MKNFRERLFSLAMFPGYRNRLTARKFNRGGLAKLDATHGGRNVGYHFLGFNYNVMKENLWIPARSKTTVCAVASTLSLQEAIRLHFIYRLR